MKTDTIAAIASGLSTSGISVIRISGSDAFAITEKIFKSASGRTVAEMNSFSVAYGHIVSDEKVVDEVLIIKMKAPKTYTREDVIEIDCHGGIVVTKAVLEAVFDAGARPAEPGEFTKRAFLNGRIDLSQAEAVSDIISAKSELALKNSIKQLRGDVKEKIAELRDKLLHETAFIEAALDDPEHYSLEGFSDELDKKILNISSEIEKLIKSSDNGRIIREGINTVILGLPNAGKSSLLNALLGQERAIVTDIAGTTRDTLEESIIMDGIAINIIDTAGIRDTSNVIEKIGVNKAKEAAADADLILYVIDAVKGMTFEDKSIIDSLGDKKIIVLINKTDISENTDIACIAEEAELDRLQLIPISAVTGEGMETLKKCISDLFFSGGLDFDNEIYITNARQKNLLKDSLSSLNNVKNSIEAGMPEDFLTIDMMAAYTSLGLITGDDVEDDLADRIFSEFCMGK